MVTIKNFNDNVVRVRLRMFSPIVVDAYYVVPTSRELQIDVTDIVRLAETGQFALYGQDATGNTVSGEVVTCKWATKGLIDPEQDIKPMSELLERWTEIASSQGVDVAVSIAPPSRILEQSGFPLIIEYIPVFDKEKNQFGLIKKED